MHTTASLDREYAFLSTIASRDDVPEGVKASLASAKQKLDSLYAKLADKYQTNGDWQRDPAMGLIKVKRVTRPMDDPVMLYGVDTPVFSTIEIQVMSAEVNVVTGNIRPLDTLVELQMPESEWGEAIASPNSGHGAATLLECDGESIAPYDPAHDPMRLRGQRMANGMHRTIDQQGDALRSTLTNALDQLRDKKRLGKKDAETLSRSLHTHFTNLPSNMGFRAEQLLNLSNLRSMALANELNLRGKGEA